MAITRYTLAVDRRFKQGDQTADFISCVCFRKAAEFAEKYFRQGMRVTVSGRIQTGSYTNKDGQKVYTTEVVVDNQEFADAKREEKKQDPEIPENDFVGVPEGLEEELPFA